MKARIDTDAFVVFGSGAASARLLAHIGGQWIPVRGDRATVKEKDNGFVGIRSTVVDLYPKTKVKFNRGFHPGGTFKFEGSWGELAAIPENKRVYDRL